MTQKQAVLRALKHAGRAGVTNGELNRQGIFRYSARIHELRADGWQIRTETGRDGAARFFLDGGPAASATPAPDGEPVLFALPRARSAYHQDVA